MGSYVFKIATQEPEKLLEAVTASLGANSRIARQVQEQMPKPKPLEPVGDCVVIVADQWPPFRKLDESFWTNQDGYQFDTWSDLAEYFPRSEFVVYRPEASTEVIAAEARQQAAKSIRDEAVDEAVDGQLPLTTVLRICEETGR